MQLVAFVIRHPGATRQEMMRGLRWGWPKLNKRLGHETRAGTIVRYVGQHNRTHHFHRDYPLRARRGWLLEAYPTLRQTFEYVRAHPGETPAEIGVEMENGRGVKRSETRWRLNRLLRWDFIRREPKPVLLPADRLLKTPGRWIVFATRLEDEGQRRSLTFEEYRRKEHKRIEGLDRRWIYRRRQLLNIPRFPAAGDVAAVSAANE